MPRLSKAFGVPVIPTIGNKAEGLEDIAPTLARALTYPVARRPACPMPEPIEHQAVRLGGLLIDHGLADARTARGAALLLLLRPSQVEHEIDEPLPHEIDRALHQARSDLAAAGFDDLSSYLVQRRYEWLDERLTDVVRREPVRRPHLSDRIDHVLTHKILGMAIFALVMFGMFASIFWLAEPAMRLVESIVTWLQQLVHARLPEGAEGPAG